MKKTYIIPETLTVTLSMCSIIAASDGQLNDNDDNPIPGGSTGMAKESADSKNIWDEEW
ncbi:MAG: hypothetical protein IJK51_06870 [Bacteroidaceae bacterium]|nr:hypothetical protein [Bacteroidaceae bacterium]